jgi:hypothetical protein
MQRRYFKATNGTVTIYRATESRAYVSAWIQAHESGRPINMGFSAKPGPLPAVEVSKEEYAALVARKMERTNARKAEIEAAGERVYRSFGSSPSDSWFFNA